MLEAFKRWIFRTTYPAWSARVRGYMEKAAEGQARLKYQRLVTSLFRTPQVESEWQSRFLSLEQDYFSLEKDWRDTLAENLGLEAENRAMKFRLLKWGVVG